MVKLLKSKYITADHKELKIKIQRDITVYTHHALPLCIILADKNLYPWYCEHYIQLYSITDNNGKLTMDFLEYWAPYRFFMEQSYLGYMDVENITNMECFVKKKIENNKYVAIYLDEYYLKSKDMYQKKHYVHPSLIYGYDDEKKEFLAVGFGKDDVFNKMTFKYNEFCTAFKQGKMHYRDMVPWAEMSAFETFEQLESKETYPFSLERFLEKLRQYICAEADDSILFCRGLKKELEHDEQIKYGMDIYEDIIHHLKNLLLGKGTIGFRSIHLLYEHAKAIKRSLNFISEIYAVSDDFLQKKNEYEEVVKLTGQFRFQYLKTALCQGADYMKDYRLEKIQDEKLISCFVDDVKQIRKKEEEILKDIYASLSSLNSQTGKNISGKRREN